MNVIRATVFQTRNRIFKDNRSVRQIAKIILSGLLLLACQIIWPIAHGFPNPIYLYAALIKKLNRRPTPYIQEYTKLRFMGD